MVLDHVFDLIGREYRNDDAARGLGQCGNAVGGFAADLVEPRAPGRIDVEADDGEPCVEQALGVDLAHQAQTDNGNGKIVHRCADVTSTLRFGVAFGFALPSASGANKAISARLIAAWRVGAVICAPSRSVT